MVQAKKLKVVKNAEIFDDRYFHTELEEFRWDEYLKDTNRKDFNEKRTRRECNNILLLFILKTFWTLVIEDIIYTMFVLLSQRIEENMYSFQSSTEILKVGDIVIKSKTKGMTFSSMLRQVGT